MTVRKSISFTEPHDKWLKSQVESGKYASDSEVIRDLIRQQQAREDKFYALRSAIEQGMQSGISEMQLPDIMAEVEARMQTNETNPIDPSSE